jgi:hypothetical protein
MANYKRLLTIIKPLARGNGQSSGHWHKGMANPLANSESEWFTLWPVVRGNGQSSGQWLEDMGKTLELCSEVIDNYEYLHMAPNQLFRQ